MNHRTEISASANPLLSSSSIPKITQKQARRILYPHAKIPGSGRGGGCRGRPPRLSEAPAPALRFAEAGRRRFLSHGSESTSLFVRNRLLGSALHISCDPAFFASPATGRMICGTTPLRGRPATPPLEREGGVRGNPTRLILRTPTPPPHPEQRRSRVSKDGALATTRGVGSPRPPRQAQDRLSIRPSQARGCSGRGWGFGRDRPPRLSDVVVNMIDGRAQGRFVKRPFLLRGGPFANRPYGPLIRMTTRPPRPSIRGFAAAQDEARRRRAFPRISRHGRGGGAWQDRPPIPWAVRFRKTGEFP